MKNLVNQLLSKFDIRVVRKSSFDSLCAKQSQLREYELSKLIDKSYLTKYFDNLPDSKSQLLQDLFVLSEVGFKNDGYFVEFGATNGVDLSNTHLLETKFGWDGILAEPAKLWHKDLVRNRGVNIETDCVWSASGERLTFNEVRDDVHSGELSTIDAYSGLDGHSRARASNGDKYEVETISMLDLLTKYGAPKKIDYLSIDTEGSEYDILNSFDFSSFEIKVISCEHNYTPLREKIYDLMIKNGYQRKYEEISLFDDWYVLR